MNSKYKKGDILLFKRRFAEDHYFYVKNVFKNSYELGELNKYDSQIYGQQSIDDNDKISFSLKEVLKNIK